MSKPKSNQVDVEPGTYIATVRTMADIGTQQVKDFNSDEMKDVKQLIIVFELVEESKKDKPVSLAKWFTNSASNKSKLVELLKASGLSKDSDLDDLLGKSVMIVVEDTESGRAKIKSFAPLKKGSKAPKGFMENSSVYLDDTYDAEAFEAMPEFIKNAILKSEEFTTVDAKAKKAKKR